MAGKKHTMPEQAKGNWVFGQSHHFSMDIIGMDVEENG